MEVRQADPDLAVLDLLTEDDFHGYQVTPEAASVMTELTTSG